MKSSWFFLRVSLIMAVLLNSCTPRPRAISYGSDACQYCSMTIVDRQHAAQLVTKKGKVIKFDAPECMLNYLKGIDTATVALLLVNDYNVPGELIDATHATYLISSEIPSPMGKFLTAFNIEAVAENAKRKHSGELFTWEQLRSRFK